MNNRVIQILRGSAKYVPSTSLEELEDGQPFYSKRTKLLYIGENNELGQKQPIKDLTAINDPKSILFTEDVKTSFKIGDVLASPDERQVLFRAGETLAQAFNRIFDPVIFPEGQEPQLHINKNEVTTRYIGELGDNWKSSTTNSRTIRTTIDWKSFIPESCIEYSSPSYSFGPDIPDNSWQWGNLTITASNTNHLAKFGNEKVTLTVTCPYTINDEIMPYAKDNHGNKTDLILSNGLAQDSITITEICQYRYFCCLYQYDDSTPTTEEMISGLFSYLKDKTDSDNNIITFLEDRLINSFTKEIKITSQYDDYIYIVTPKQLYEVTQGGYIFPISLIGSYIFTNHYGETYDVYVYKSAKKLVKNTEFLLNLEFK